MFNNNGGSQMFNKKKKEVWLVIEKRAYSNDEAIGFKVALDKLNDRDNQSYFIATDVESATDEVIKFHNQKVANDNK